MLFWLLVAGPLGSLLGCVKDAEDTGFDCTPSGEPSLTIGQGVAGEFYPIEEGATVGLTSAPQGGFGVGVRAQVTGLVVSEGRYENAPMPVLQETYIDGELSDSFTNTGATAYCQGDGSGLVWDLVVGFDRETYSSADDLFLLQGIEATLLLAATDLDGNEARGEVDVVIEVE